MIALATATVTKDSQPEALDVDMTPEEHRYHHYNRYGHHGYGHGGRYVGGYYRGRRSVEEAPVEDLEAQEHRFGGYGGYRGGYGGYGSYGGYGRYGGGYHRGHHYG